MAGSFTGSTTFGGTTLTSSGEEDLFLVKYRPDGSVAWALGGGGHSDDGAGAVAVQEDGTAYLTGYYCYGPATFGNVTLPVTAACAALSLKVGPDGAVVWAVASDVNDTGRALALLPDGTSYVTGGMQQIFLAKYGESGSVEWAVSAGEGRGEALATAADGSVYLAGTLGITGGSAFVAKYAADGSALWTARTWPASAPKSVGAGTSVAVAPDGTVVTVGNVTTDTFTLGGVTITKEPAESVLILARYNPDGSVASVAELARGSGSSVTKTLGVQPDGRALVLGNLNGELTIESPSSGVATTGFAGHVPFLLELDPSGEPASIAALATADGAAEAVGISLALQPDGRAYVAGQLQGTARFAGGAVLASGGAGTDVFVAKYGE